MLSNKCLNYQIDLGFRLWLPANSYQPSDQVSCLTVFHRSVEAALEPLPLDPLHATFTAACDILRAIWRSRWPQRVVPKKEKKERSHSLRFQFSTLMNHNQINHKLLPQFQTDNMAPKHIWLQVSVYLVKKQQVDKLAQPVFGQPATENCIRESARRAVNLFTTSSAASYEGLHT